MKNRPIYITGHKNPDTDSIVSSLAYAYYKNAQGYNCIAGRIGPVSSETEFLLDKFGFKDPERLFTARSLVKEIETDEACLVSKDITMKEALDIILNVNNKTLFVVDDDKKLEGVVAIGDLLSIWAQDEETLASLIKTIKFNDLVKILNAEVVLEGSQELSGSIKLFPRLTNRISKAGAIVVLGNNDDILEYVIDCKAAILVVLGEDAISEKIISKAKENSVSIIRSKLSPLKISRLIFQSVTIENMMIPENKVITCNINETVEDASSHISKSRFRSYPVVDDDKHVLGAVSRYHLFNYEKKGLILVDHNEKKQSIDDIDSGEILEIVDHHRIGGFETTNPISITTMTVGATATIITKKLLDDGIVIDKNLAGILLGAIISDTMLFKSPTTTPLDIELGQKLEEISGVKAAELFEEMIGASESILNKRNIEIVHDDFKEFDIAGMKVGLSQAICKSKEEYDALKDKLSGYLEDSCITSGYELLVVMLTHPNGSGSYLMYTGPKSAIVEKVFPDINTNPFVAGLVSRKKQLLPTLIKAMEE